MKRWIGPIFLSIAVLSPHAANAATILWDQLPGSVAGTWNSQKDTTPGGFGNFATAYDDFTLGVTALVTGVQWDGQYYPDKTGAITGFTVTFWADAAGQPGAPLLANFIAGSAGETSIGPGGFGPAFSYGSDLPIGFLATAGTKYWISIAADLAYPPQWGWNKTSPPGGGVSFQDFLGVRYQRDDLAFRLVPEPATLLLLGAGLGASYFKRRRRA